MLTDVTEDAATGQIAEIYGEVRRLWAVPYVSSLQRHLASKPGWLEWSWAALGPAFTSGQAQDAGWQAAAGLPLPGVQAWSWDEWQDLSLDANDRRIIADVCAGFVRVAPVNMMFAGMLRRLLFGERSDGTGWSNDWQPPAALPEPPAMVDVGALPKQERAALLQLATDNDGVPFVPGLYRILARWPGYLAHLSEQLVPMKAGDATLAAQAALLEKIDTAIAELFAELLPPPPGMPPSNQNPAVLTALDTYRQTSPEMIIYGQLIAAMLPVENAR